MKILLVAATMEEIAPLPKKYFKPKKTGINSFSFSAGKNKIDVLITGSGIANTAFWLGKTLAKKRYDLAVNAGIAGSFRKNIPPGQLVNVTEDCFADFGAEDGGKFLTALEIGLISEIKFYPFGFKNQILSSFPKAKAITVNTVHGNEFSIRKVVCKFNPDIESMEGAAFFFVCNEEKIPCVQLRAVSNMIEKRNKKKWKTESAIKNLSSALRAVLDAS